MSSLKKAGERNAQLKDKREREPDDFVSVARRLDCDEDKSTFEGKLAKIAKVNPSADKRKAPAKARANRQSDRRRP